MGHHKVPESTPGNGIQIETQRFHILYQYAEIIFFMYPANKIWCYSVMSYLIGWVRTQIDPWVWGQQQYKQ